MHRGRGPWVVVPTVLTEASSEASEKLEPTAGEGAPPTPEATGTAEKVHNGEGTASFELGRFPVTVPEPPGNRVRDGRIHLFGVGRLRSLSNRANSLKSLFIKDTWSKAELYLTDTTLCYRIDGTGVCNDAYCVCVIE